MREFSSLSDFLNTVTCQECRNGFYNKIKEEELKKQTKPAPQNKTLPTPQKSEWQTDENYLIKGDVLKLYTGNAEKFTVPDGVKSIGDSAFARCQELASVEIPDSVGEIRDFAFALCQNLTEIILPQNIRFGEHVFHECQDLSVVKIRFPGGIVGTFERSALDVMFRKS